MQPCLLSSHRTRVLWIGVEGFPHSGFRHFIRYINVRGVTPEEQGEFGFRERSQDVSTHRVHLKTDHHTPNKGRRHIDGQEGEAFL